MSNGFTFDVAAAIEQMEHCTVIDLAHQELTVYGFICLNEDNVSSHGGQIVAIPNGKLSSATVDRAINEAVAAAVDINQDSPADHTCRYVPVAIAFPTHLIDDLRAQLLRDPRAETLVVTPPKEDAGE
jgi:hypothetical protein